MSMQKPILILIRHLSYYVKYGSFLHLYYLVLQQKQTKRGNEFSWMHLNISTQYYS